MASWRFEQVVLLRVNVGNLHLAFGCERVGGKTGSAKVGEQMRPMANRCSGFHVDAKASCCRRLSMLPPDGFQSPWQCPGAAMGGALSSIRLLNCDAVVSRVSASTPPWNMGAKFDEGQAMVLLHEAGGGRWAVQIRIAWSSASSTVTADLGACHLGSSV